MPSSKMCKSCKIIKSLSEFDKQKLGKFGKRSTCKSCRHKKYLENKSESDKYWKEYRQKNRDILIKRKRKEYKRNYLRYLYSNIKYRCTNPKSSSYKNYGGRGIKILISYQDVCYLWQRDKAWLLKKPSIDRIDNDGDYTIENCQFIENDINSIKNKVHKISQYTLSGDYIATYKSKAEAERKTGICSTSISRAIKNNNGKFKKYIWRREE